MRFEETRPFVRFASSIALSTAVHNQQVAARDCRLLTVREGHVRVTLEREHLLSPGDCLYIPAGMPYCFSSPSAAPATLLIINFDFSWEHADLRQPLPTFFPADPQPVFSVPTLEDAPCFSRALIFSRLHILESALQEIAQEFSDQRLFMHSRLSAIMFSVLTQLARIQLTDQPRHPKAVETALQWIGAHYMEPLSNQQLAQAVNYHPNYLNRLFLRHTGQTLHQYLINRRIQKALELLLSSDLSITEIALSVGFSSLNRFTKEFTARTGNPPSRYRNQK